MRYNLLHEQWIPVIDRHGRHRQAGIRHLLLRADEFERIGPVSPLEEVVLHRLLLAILHRALEGPKTVEDILKIYSAGRFPEREIESYLDRFAHRFDLFSSDYPFFQVPDLADHVEPRPWTTLVPDYATGNNPTLFDHSMDDRPVGISPAQAARALLVHQSFAPGGLIRRLGVTAVKLAPLASSSVFLLVGRSLFETLLLNLIPYSDPTDQAIWERDPYYVDDVAEGKARELFTGVARAYTWMSRSVRLQPDSDGLIRQIAYGPGVEALDAPFRDPMIAHHKVEGALRPYVAQPERAFWRDFEAVLPGETAWTPPQVLDHAARIWREVHDSSLLIPMIVVSEVINLRQQGKVLDVRREVYPFPVRAMEPETASYIHDALDTAREVDNGLGRAAWAVAHNLLTLSRRKATADDIKRLVQSFPLQREYWSRLEHEFPAFLERLAKTDPEAALASWRDVVRRSALKAWGATAMSLGTMSRHFKALATGESMIRAILGG